MRVYPFILLFASALVESVSTGNASKVRGTTMAALNYPQPEADNLKDIPAKRLVLANETTENEDRMHPSPSSVEKVTKLKFKLMLSESSAEAVRRFETLFPLDKPQHAEVKPKVGKVISFVQSNAFENLVAALNTRDKALLRQEYESLCKGLHEHFGDDAVASALYYLKKDNTITPRDSVEKLLNAQMAYWKKKKLSNDKVLEILIGQEESHEMVPKFQWNVERLERYMKSNNPTPSRPLYATLYQTLINGYARKDKKASVPEMIADLTDGVTKTQLNLLVPHPQE